MELNKRISAITPSVTLAITSRAKQMAAEGRSVCSFSAGEPDFDTPNSIKGAAEQALADGATKYAPVPGLPVLRDAIVAKLDKDNGLTYSADQVVVSNGAKHSLFNVIMAMCSEGDQVIIPSPFWLSYPEMVRMAGAEPVFVPCSETNDYKMTLDQIEAAITDQTKALIVNSPSNPIGVVYTEEDLRAVAEVAVAHGLYVISDEIYEKIVYDGVTHASIGSFSPEIFERTITVNGFSKAYAMTGWRLGYFAGPSDLAAAVRAYQSHSTSGANTFAQHGAVKALQVPEDSLQEMVTAFAERRSVMYDRLIAIEGVTCVKPMGAFYMLPNISSFGLDSLTFAERLLEEKGVALVPGKPFGADQNVRLSYACPMENINEGLDRLEDFVKGL